MRRLLVSIPEYHAYATPPQNFEDLIARLGRKGGFWRVEQIDKASGETVMEQWCENLITDNGAVAALKAIMGSAGSGITPASIIAIDQSYGCCSTTASISAGGTVTSITVGAITGATIASGTAIVVGAGTNNKLTLQLTASITGAGTYGVTSVSGPGSQISAGANVRVATPAEALAAGYTTPSTADVASLSAPVSYTSALSSGNFTYTATTGYQNRAAQVTTAPSNDFSTTGTPAATTANYTAAWLVNANPVASTSNTFAHVAFDAPQSVSSTSVVRITVVEKL